VEFSLTSCRFMDPVFLTRTEPSTIPHELQCPWLRDESFA
jgi:hypothetical protein